MPFNETLYQLMTFYYQDKARRQTRAERTQTEPLKVITVYEPKRQVERKVFGKK